MRRMIGQIAWFVAVGCAAALTHWLVAVGCVERGGLPPWAANIVGWLVAFTVSFSGHYRLTFRRQPKTLMTAFYRFFLVSATGFAVNETAYLVLLQVTTLRYDLLLAAILIAVAALTYVVSRLWAFRHTSATP